MPQTTGDRLIAFLIVLIVLVSVAVVASYLTAPHPTRILEHGPVYLTPSS